MSVSARDHSTVDSHSYGEVMAWSPQAPRFAPLHLLLSWLVAGVAVFVAAAILPGVSVGGFGDAVVAAALIAVLNAVLPPIVAALRLPFTLALGFVVVLVLDALILLLASHISSKAIQVDSFGWALLAAVVISAAMLVLEVIFGANDDDTYSLRVIRRIARRQGRRRATDVPGIVFLEIDGLARRSCSGRSATATRRRWRAGSRPARIGSTEWEPDLSSQTGASQAGILLGSNDDIPAFRWVEKETGKVMTCSSPADCAEIERRLATGNGLLARRRRQPRQPVLRRGRRDDPHRQPDERREARQPRLPRVPRQRLQRHAGARAVHLGGRARVGRGGRASAGATCRPRGHRGGAIRSCARRCASACGT